MGVVPRRAAGLLFLSLGLASYGQGLPVNSTDFPPQSGSSGSQNQPNAKTTTQDALENPVLEEADEDRNITYMDSTVAFEYRREEMEGGSSWDNFELEWQQAFGHSRRLAIDIELPFIHASAGDDEPSAGGTGDMKLGFKGILGKGEKFEHAAGVEVTLPSASRNAIGDGETVLRFAWGCSAQLTEHTLLNAEVGYNKPVQNQRSTNAPGTNSIEPELILAQGFAKHLAGFLDWDSYYDFSASDYVPTMRAGLEVAFDRKEKWTLSPYVTFPLNHAARIFEIKSAAGFVLAYRY
jgi:hypothetical protein